MSELTIWHNRQCSKSRQALALLEDKGLTPTVRQYLKDAPSADELRQAIAALGVEPRGLMRTKDKVYKELALETVTDPEALIQAMAEHPRLIERPVVFHGGKAAIGRPTEAILEIL